MKRLSYSLLAAWASVSFLVGTVPVAARQASPAPSPSPAQPPSATQPAGKARWVAPVKGQAEIGYLNPEVKVEKDIVITTFKIKNLSMGAIAGLRVDEYWWDKGNNPVGGDTQRVKKLIMPGEIVEVVLRTPKKPTMFRNQFQFTHANGTIKPKILKKL